MALTRRRSRPRHVPVLELTGETHPPPREAGRPHPRSGRWCEASLADPPTVTVSGVTTPVTGADPQREIVAAAAAQARGNGRPIRARVTTPGGDVHRLIVTPTGRVVRLDQPDRPTPAAPGKPDPAHGNPARCDHGKTKRKARPRETGRTARAGAGPGVVGRGPVPAAGPLGRAACWGC